ncbi:unnamed protein product, partial [marine sediment metagenome]
MGYWKWLFKKIFNFFGVIKYALKLKGYRVLAYGFIIYGAIGAIAIMFNQVILVF